MTIPGWFIKVLKCCMTNVDKMTPEEIEYLYIRIAKDAINAEEVKSRLYYVLKERREARENAIHD